MLSGRRACGERGWIIMLMPVPPALSSVPAGLPVVRKCFALTEE